MMGVAGLSPWIVGFLAMFVLFFVVITVVQARSAA
jgi:hypothetical protein